MTTSWHDGIHIYARSESGTITHTVDDSNDIELTPVGAPERLVGWPTEAMRECENENGEHILVGCDADGRIVEVNVTEPTCECSDCGGCAEVATTRDDGDNPVCDACADYATDEDGNTYCSRCDEYVDEGEWTGGGSMGWVSKPRVRKEES